MQRWHRQRRHDGGQGRRLHDAQSMVQQLHKRAIAEADHTPKPRADDGCGDEYAAGITQIDGGIQRLTTARGDEDQRRWPPPAETRHCARVPLDRAAEVRVGVGPSSEAGAEEANGRATALPALARVVIAFDDGGACDIDEDAAGLGAVVGIDDDLAGPRA